MAKSSMNFEKANATGHSEAYNLREDIPKNLLPKEHWLGSEYWQHEKKTKRAI